MPGDSNCAMVFFDTISKVVTGLRNTPLLEWLNLPILRALLRMTIKVPLLYESTFEFLIQSRDIEVEHKMEGFYILSRAYLIDEEQWK